MDQVSYTKLVLLIGKATIERTPRHKLNKIRYVAQDLDGYRYGYSSKPKWVYDRWLPVATFNNVATCIVLAHAPIRAGASTTLVKL